jgi:hypothetical protein
VSGISTHFWLELAQCVTEGEIEDMEHLLPKDL